MVSAICELYKKLVETGKLNELCYLNNYFNDNLCDNYNLQRKWGSDTKTKAIERESKNIMWVWERKLSQKLSKNGHTNIISQIKLECYDLCWLLCVNNNQTQKYVSVFLLVFNFFFLNHYYKIPPFITFIFAFNSTFEVLRKPPVIIGKNLIIHLYFVFLIALLWKRY